MNHLFCQGLDGHHYNIDLACVIALLFYVCYALHYHCPPSLIYKNLNFLRKTIDLIMFISIKVVVKGP